MNKKDKFTMVAVHTRIDPDSDRELERIANLNYVTKSSVIRWAIMYYLKEEYGYDKEKA